MIEVNKEYYSSPYYFFLRDKGKNYSLYFSVESNLNEARRKDENLIFEKKKGRLVKKYIDKVLKDKKIKDTKTVKKNLEELISPDGSMSNSKIPILDPKLHPRKTMDQTVAAASITNDPITRGYRTYYGESVEETTEEDMSKAFGYEETKDLPPVKTIKKLKNMGVSDPIGRAREMGKEPKMNKTKKKGSDMRIRLTEKEKIENIRKDKMKKMIEEILFSKKSSEDLDVQQKETDISPIIIKNLKSLKRQAERQGISVRDLIKYMRSE